MLLRGERHAERETINPECSEHSELLKAKHGEPEKAMGPPLLGNVLKVGTLVQNDA